MGMGSRAFWMSVFNKGCKAWNDGMECIVKKGKLSELTIFGGKESNLLVFGIQNEYACFSGHPDISMDDGNAIYTLIADVNFFENIPRFRTNDNDRTGARPTPKLVKLFKKEDANRRGRKRYVANDRQKRRFCSRMDSGRRGIGGYGQMSDDFGYFVVVMVGRRISINGISNFRLEGNILSAANRTKSLENNAKCGAVRGHRLPAAADQR